MFRQTNLPDESREYLAKREEVRLAELDLMRQRERVAQLRRSLPEGPVIHDYVFEGIHLTDLFSHPGRALIVYHMMFGKKQTEPCPMCTAWVDCLNGIAHHIEQKADLAVVAAADSEALRDFARTRGWNNVRLLSCGVNTFKLDMGSEDSNGVQDSMISVFTLGSDGKPRHFYSGHPRLSPEVKERGIDELNPIWNFLDLTPKGREDFVAKLQY